MDKLWIWKAKQDKLYKQPARRINSIDKVGHMW